MLIGISGTISSGKTEVARYLTFQGFKLIQFKGLDEGLKFQTESELLDYVTINWRENFVLLIDNFNLLKLLQKRPFFLHISIDAPINLRFKRQSKYTFDEFISLNDELLFNLDNPLIEINNQACVKIINTSESIKELYMKVSELNLLDKSRLRPSWDSYFMKIANLAALRSNCMKRRVGCVIVRESRVVATGYNGTPRHLKNCNEGGCSRCNKGHGSGNSLSTCLCLHAEENALLEAGRDRIGDSSTLYCNTCPCLTCSIKIVQSGIKEVVYAQSYSMDVDSHKVMSEAKIILRQYQPPIDGIFI
ncbi:unnamed protein product [Candida verbasci]|uniref:Deoxycytidylate deaminase n=1 Tax=Candida verbasci TaxID=1227364 RepID=A0A9W4TVR4_9ASCO|nr:unnamed protein product [Candida verbasci]